MTDSIASSLHLAPHTWLTRNTKLFLAFLLSGLMHSAGDYGMYNGSKWFSLRFFILQPFAIMAEDAVIEWWGGPDKKKVVGDRDSNGKVKEQNQSGERWKTYLGWSWVAFCFCVTMPEFGYGFWPTLPGGEVVLKQT